MLSLFRTPRAKPEETEVSAKGENKGKAPADAKVKIQTFSGGRSSEEEFHSHPEPGSER